jgi:hypothetical protein
MAAINDSEMYKVFLQIAPPFNENATLSILVRHKANKCNYLSTTYRVVSVHGE